MFREHLPRQLNNHIGSVRLCGGDVAEVALIVGRIYLTEVAATIRVRPLGEI